ncbi:YojJ [Bacillus pumilus SAFR-032]|uniref:YojJ n=1 Tax=Bacillus pumilus (strain SAFR-032) TaxID=315750 RepID=A8FE70_BACP2|nr:YojJ [Bacillus pumilus SAFR-032]
MINRTNEEAQFKVGMRTHLMKIMKDASDIIDSLDEIEQCLLCDLESLHDEFNEMHAEASSFYLQSYMEEYTPGFAQFSLAIENLSKQKHGALIVIQRRDEVEDFIQRGTNLHAKISASLIESIFYPGNPLHDGALLVKENTLVSAANVLPLTSKKSQSFSRDKTQSCDWTLWHDRCTCSRRFRGNRENVICERRRPLSAHCKRA